MQVNVELTENQTYGLMFAVQQANVQLAQENHRIRVTNAQDNTTTPEKPEWTLETYMAKLLTDAADSQYNALLNYKQQIAITKFNAASPEKQTEVLTLLDVQDVV